MQRLHRNILLIALGALLIPTPAAAGSRSDDRIKAAVEAALARAEIISGISGLRAQCEEGILTLKGIADTRFAIDQAVRLAGAVPGVVDVVVSATVPRQRVPDAVILAEVQRALQIPSFAFVSIQATVGYGRVMLSGSSGSYAQKILAEREISKISGVLEIQNRITVKSETNVSEKRLASLVAARLISESSPVSGVLKVAIRGKVAVLSGRVPLFLTRLEATEAALSIPGIHEVDNRLVVDPNLTPLPSHPTRP